jgi:hypothetical protein
MRTAAFLTLGLAAVLALPGGLTTTRVDAQGVGGADDLLPAELAYAHAAR